MSTESVTNATGLSTMQTKISEAGTIGADGKLRMPMDRVNQFFAGHKGARVVATFEVAAPGSTEAQKGYYYNYIVPTIQQALAGLGDRLSADGVDAFLIGEYPGDTRRADGTEAVRGRELNQCQMSDFIGWLKQFAAENLDTYIEDAKII